jgi:hypothetical protein
MERVECSDFELAADLGGTLEAGRVDRDHVAALQILAKALPRVFMFVPREAKPAQRDLGLRSGKRRHCPFAIVEHPAGDKLRSVFGDVALEKRRRVDEQHQRSRS